MMHRQHLFFSIIEKSTFTFIDDKFIGTEIQIKNFVKNIWRLDPSVSHPYYYKFEKILFVYQENFY